MDRARSVLKVGALVMGVIILITFLVMSMDGELRLSSMIDLVWKVLVLLLLADISLKLGARDDRKGRRSE